MLITFNLFVKHVGDSDDKIWSENYTHSLSSDTVEEVSEHGKKIVNSFNTSLRPYEQVRQFVKVEIIDTVNDNDEYEEDWEDDED